MSRGLPAQRWEGSAEGMGLTVLVGGLDRGVWEVLTGLGCTPCMTESRVPGRPRSGRGDERTGRPSPCSPGLCCVLHVSTLCGASRSLGEEGGPPRLHVLCWALGAWGPTCRFLVQVQRLPPGHAQAHAQGVRLHPPGARHQQGGLRQRPEHRCVPPRAACTRALPGPRGHLPGAGGGAAGAPLRERAGSCQRSHSRLCEPRVSRAGGPPGGPQPGVKVLSGSWLCPPEEFILK